MEVYCGLCGEKSHELFSHLKRIHEISPAHYRERCPGAPLVSEDLLSYMNSERIAPMGQSLKKTVDLFGLSFQTDLLPGEGVPQLDEDYLLPERLSRQVLASLQAGEKILLVGPTGSGKSTLIEQLASRLSWPVVRVAASGGLTESDLLGEWTVRDGETVFNYGFLPRAMQQGAICLVDEIDGMEPAVAFSLHQLMEDGGTLVLLQNGGEQIHPHPDFRLVTTANTLGNADDSGLYTGTRVLNAAFLDRFAAVFRVDYLPPKQELEVLRSRVPGCPKPLARKLVNVATDIRQARENDQVYCTFSTRRLIDVARKYTQLDDLPAALELAVLNRLTGEDTQVVFEVFQRHLGDLLARKETDTDDGNKP